jgi:broad specificity phosphatase PhoE
LVPCDEYRHSSLVLFDPLPDRVLVTTFLLIRHAHCDPIGISIAGRAPGVHLNDRGRAEAEQLGERLAPLRITGIYSSPLERALETAGPMARRQEVGVETAPGLLEIDFGAWTGKTLNELHRLAEWKAFNSYRSGTRIPGGEIMAEVLARALAELDRIARRHSDSDSLLAIVSHGDVLRTLVGHFLGIPADLFQRLEISPASVTVVSLDSDGARVLLLNSTSGWPSEVNLRA